MHHHIHMIIECIFLRRCLLISPNNSGLSIYSACTSLHTLLSITCSILTIKTLAHDHRRCSSIFAHLIFPFLKSANNRNTSKKCEMWRRSGFFLLLTLNKLMLAVWCSTGIFWRGRYWYLQQMFKNFTFLLFFHPRLSWDYLRSRRLTHMC